MLGDVAVLRNTQPFAGERDMNTVREIDVIWFGVKFYIPNTHTFMYLRFLLHS